MMTTNNGQVRRRLDADYEIEAVTKSLQVLEALEGIGFEPVSVQTIMGRTGFSKDFVFRSLKTMQLRGYVTRLPDGKWTVGQRILRFSGRYSDLALRALSQK